MMLGEPDNLLDAINSLKDPLNVVAANTKAPIQNLGYTQYRGRQDFLQIFPAQTEVLITVPMNFIYDINSIILDLTCDSNAANRATTIRVQTPNGGTTMWRTPITPSMTASKSWFNFFAKGYPVVETSFDGNNTIRGGWPELQLLPSWTLATVSSNLQVGDYYGIEFQADVWELNGAS